MLNANVILNQIPNFVFWKDLNSAFMGCNTAFANMAGFSSPEEIIGKTDNDFIWAPYAEIYKESDRKALNGEIKKPFLETQVQGSGKFVINIVNKAPLYNQSDEKVGIIGSFSEYEIDMSVDILGEKLSRMKFSKREVECAKLLMTGLSSKQISAELNLSRRTIEHYIDSIKGKICAANRSELIIKLLSI